MSDFVRPINKLAASVNNDSADIKQTDFNKQTRLILTGGQQNTRNITSGQFGQ